MLTTFFLIVNNVFFYHVIFCIFPRYNNAIFLFMANWGKHCRSLLDPLLFFRCCSQGQGYGMNLHVDRSKSKMKLIVVTLYVLLHTLLLYHDDVTNIVVASYCCYKLLLLHPGCRYKLLLSSAVVTSKTVT